MIGEIVLGVGVFFLLSAAAALAIGSMLAWRNRRDERERERREELRQRAWSIFGRDREYLPSCPCTIVPVTSERSWLDDLDSEHGVSAPPINGKTVH